MPTPASWGSSSTSPKAARTSWPPSLLPEQIRTLVTYIVSLTTSVQHRISDIFFTSQRWPRSDYTVKSTPLISSIRTVKATLGTICRSHWHHWHYWHLPQPQRQANRRRNFIHSCRSPRNIHPGQGAQLPDRSVSRTSDTARITRCHHGRQQCSCYNGKQRFGIHQEVQTLLDGP